MLQSSKNIHICPEEKYSSALKRSCSLASLHKTISIGVYICIFHKSQSWIKGTESELYVSYKYKSHLTNRHHKEMNLDITNSNLPPYKDTSRYLQVFILKWMKSFWPPSSDLHYTLANIRSIWHQYIKNNLNRILPLEARKVRSSYSCMQSNEKKSTKSSFTIHTPHK